MKAPPPGWMKAPPPGRMKATLSLLHVEAEAGQLSVRRAAFPTTMTFRRLKKVNSSAPEAGPAPQDHDIYFSSSKSDSCKLEGPASSSEVYNYRTLAYSGGTLPRTYKKVTRCLSLVLDKLELQDQDRSQPQVDHDDTDLAELHQDCFHVPDVEPKSQMTL